MITPERQRELAGLAAKTRAEEAVKLTTWYDVYKTIRDLDDFIGQPDMQVREIADGIASLTRTGQIVATFPQLYVGKGDGEPVDVEPEEVVHLSELDGNDNPTGHALCDNGEDDVPPGSLSYGGPGYGSSDPTCPRCITLRDA